MDIIQQHFYLPNRRMRRIMSKISKNNSLYFLEDETLCIEYAKQMNRDTDKHIQETIIFDLTYLDKNSEYMWFYIVTSLGKAKKFGQNLEKEHRTLSDRLSEYINDYSKTRIIDEKDVIKNSMPFAFKVPVSIVIKKSKKYNNIALNSANHYDQEIMWDMINNTSAKQTREYLAENGKRNLSSSVSVESIADISFFEIIKYVIEYFTGNKSKKEIARALNYTPYFYQDEASTKLNSILKEKNIANLIAPTRSGKSIIISYLIKKGEFKSVVIITPYPNGYSSFNKMINKSKEFEGYQIVKYENGVFKAFHELTKVKVYFVSWQALKNSKSSALEVIKSVNPDLIVIDEFHRESDSEISMNLMDDIKSLGTKILNVSATPYDEMLKGLISDSNSCVITREAIKKFRRENNLSDYQQFFFMMNLKEVFESYLSKKEKSEWNSKEMPTYAKMFSMIKQDGFDVGNFTDEDITKEEVSTWSFKYESALINTMIYFLSTEKIGGSNSKKTGLAGNQDLLKNYNLSNNANARMKDIFLNILLLVPSSPAAFILDNLFKKNDRLCDLGIVTKCSVSSSLNGEFVYNNGDTFKHTPNERESEELKIDAWMKDANEGGNRTMLITAMSHTTAETLSHLSCIVLMREMTSHELFMQLLGRPNNTGNDKIRYTGFVVPKGIFVEQVAKAYNVSTELYPNDKVSISQIIMNWYDCADTMFYTNNDTWQIYLEEKVLRDIGTESVNLKNKIDHIDPINDVDGWSGNIKDIVIDLGKQNPNIIAKAIFSNNENLGKNGEQTGKRNKSGNKINKIYNERELMILGYKFIVNSIDHACDYAKNNDKISHLEHFTDILSFDDETWLYAGISIDIIKLFLDNICDSNKSALNRYIHSNF